LSKRTEFVISDDNDVFLKLTKKSDPVVIFSNPFKMTGRLGFGGHREYNPRRRTESEFHALA